MIKKNLYKINVLFFVLLLWCIPWWIYNCFLRTKKFHPMGKNVFYTPKWMSCAIPYVSTNPKKNNCENVKFDGWSIGHILIYMTLGMVLPGYWFQILILSYACEIFEYIVGWRARWIIDPLVNMFGYLLGHLVFFNLRWIPFLNTYTGLFWISLSLIFILFMNRPCMIPRGMEFY